MIELIAMVCSLSAPFNCKDVSLNVSDNYTPMQCLMYSQHEAAKYVTEHPGWRVAKLTCGKLGRYAKA